LEDPLLGAPRSGAPGYYVDWTDRYTDDILAWFTAEDGERLVPEPPRRDRNNEEKGRGYHLYVVRGLWEDEEGRGDANADKGREPWTHSKGSDLADDRFCFLGFARRPEPSSVAARPFFRQANPDGVVCCAQAMVYNANPQRSPEEAARSGRLQPRVGWDTLNWWDSDAYEFDPQRRAAERTPDHQLLPGIPFRLPPARIIDRAAPEPKIRVNWQAKLVPVTERKLSAAAGLVSDSTITSYVKQRLGVPGEYDRNDSNQLINH
jgi:hypothetical protein